MGLRSLAPDAAHGLLALSRSPFVKQLNESIWTFAAIETLHLLSLAVLGGAVFILNLHLLGLALQQVPSQDVERATRSWLWIGIAGTTTTGAAMAIATATGLLDSAAFLVKMIALVAAILLSLVVSSAVRHGGKSGRSLGAFAGIALLLWLAALLLFASTSGLRSGALLVALTGFALLGAFIVRRRTYAAGVILIIGGGMLVASLAARDDQGLALWLNMSVIGAALLFAAALAVTEIRAGHARQWAPARVSAFASTLAWVTVAAAGRWIGFS